MIDHQSFIKSVSAKNNNVAQPQECIKITQMVHRQLSSQQMLKFVSIEVSTIRYMASTAHSLVYKGIARTENSQHSEEIVIKSALSFVVQKSREARERNFINEINYLTYLFHFNVRHMVSYFCLVENFESSYINIDRALVLPHCGISLKEMMDHKGTLTFCKIQLYMIQILETLEDLEKVQVIHGDLKTLNITQKGDALTLIDWGLSTMTNHNMIGSITTIYYRPPECLFNEVEDANVTATHRLHRRSCAMDIWSLGCIFWELATESVLFDKETIQEVVDEIFEALGHPPKNLVQFARNRQIVYDPSRVFFRTKMWQFFATALIRKGASAQGAYDAIHLIKKMLQWDPVTRITPSEALKHPFFNNQTSSSSSSSSANSKTQS